MSWISAFSVKYIPVFHQYCRHLCTVYVDQLGFMCEGFSKRYKMQLSPQSWDFEGWIGGLRPDCGRTFPTSRKRMTKQLPWGMVNYCRPEQGSLSLGRGNHCCDCGYHLAARKQKIGQSGMCFGHVFVGAGRSPILAIPCFVLKQVAGMDSTQPLS